MLQQQQLDTDDEEEEDLIHASTIGIYELQTLLLGLGFVWPCEEEEEEDDNERDEDKSKGDNNNNNKRRRITLQQINSLVQECCHGHHVPTQARRLTIKNVLDIVAKLDRLDRKEELALWFQCGLAANSTLTNNKHVWTRQTVQDLAASQQQQPTLSNEDAQDMLQLMMKANNAKDKHEGATFEDFYRFFSPPDPA